MINPTVKAETKIRHKSVSPISESTQENPATTKKFVAYVEKRRKEMEKKI